MKEYAKKNDIKFLVIDCTHSLYFINLDECYSIQDLINVLQSFDNQEILRVGFASIMLKNW